MDPYGRAEARVRALECRMATLCARLGLKKGQKTVDLDTRDTIVTSWRAIVRIEDVNRIAATAESVLIDRIGFVALVDVGPFHELAKDVALSLARQIKHADRTHQFGVASFKHIRDGRAVIQYVLARVPGQPDVVNAKNVADDVHPGRTWRDEDTADLARFEVLA